MKPIGIPIGRVISDFILPKFKIVYKIEECQTENKKKLKVLETDQGDNKRKCNGMFSEH